MKPSIAIAIVAMALAGVAVFLAAVPQQPEAVRPVAVPTLDLATAVCAVSALGGAARRGAVAEPGCMLPEGSCRDRDMRQIYCEL